MGAAASLTDGRLLGFISSICIFTCRFSLFISHLRPFGHRNPGADKAQTGEVFVAHGLPGEGRPNGRPLEVGNPGDVGDGEAGVLEPAGDCLQLPVAAACKLLLGDFDVHNALVFTKIGQLRVIRNRPEVRFA